MPKNIETYKQPEQTRKNITPAIQLKRLIQNTERSLKQTEQTLSQDLPKPKDNPSELACWVSSTSTWKQMMKTW